MLAALQLRWSCSVEALAARLLPLVGGRVAAWTAARACWPSGAALVRVPAPQGCALGNARRGAGRGGFVPPTAVPRATRLVPVRAPPGGRRSRVCPLATAVAIAVRTLGGAGCRRATGLAKVEPPSGRRLAGRAPSSVTLGWWQSTRKGGGALVKAREVRRQTLF